MESMISTNYYMSNRGLNYSSEATNYSSDEEPSSWDLYIEEFTEEESLFSSNESSFGASYSTVKKHRYDNDKDSDGSCRVSLTPSQRICGRLSANKRRKIEAAYVDQDLEDTASSPDHTPKVNNFNHQLYMNYSKEMMGINFQEGDLNDRKDEGVSLQGKGSDKDHTDLRRKGLCLVPLSLFLEYDYVSN